MRLTMKNHSSNTYRASLIRQDNNCLVGDVVNKLGRYEDICEDLQELEKIVKEHKKRTHKLKWVLIFISLSEKITSLILYQVLRTKARKIAVEIPLFRLAKGIKSETKGEWHAIHRKDSNSRENNRDPKILQSQDTSQGMQETKETEKDNRITEKD